MVQISLSLILTGIFLFIGGLHLYWMFGGTWGLYSAIPSKETYVANSFKVPKIVALIIALLLLSCAALYFINSGLSSWALPYDLLHYGYWIIPSAFLLRAIGDFNYVGFFKKIKNTKFAEADSKIFIPLCLTIGALGFTLQLIK